MLLLSPQHTTSCLGALQHEHTLKASTHVMQKLPFSAAVTQTLQQGP
jgi:hypothetical protein